MSTVYCKFSIKFLSITSEFLLTLYRVSSNIIYTDVFNIKEGPPHCRDLKSHWTNAYAYGRIRKEKKMKKIISFRKICLLMSLIMVFSVISPTIASADYTVIDDIVFSSKDLANAEISRQGRDMIVIKSTSTNSSNYTSLIQSFEDQSFQLKSEEVNITALLFNNEEDVDKVYRELMSVPYEQSNYRVNGDIAAGLRAHTTVYYTEETVDGSPLANYIMTDIVVDRLELFPAEGDGLPRFYWQATFNCSNPVDAYATNGTIQTVCPFGIQFEVQWYNKECEQQ